MLIWNTTMSIKPEPVFIDTSGFIGAMVAADQYFKRSAPFLSELIEQSVPIITTNLVLTVTYPLIYRFSYPQNALRFLEIITEACQKNYLTLVYSAASHHQHIRLDGDPPIILRFFSYKIIAYS
jgi:hypothetical protein